MNQLRSHLNERDSKTINIVEKRFTNIENPITTRCIFFFECLSYIKTPKYKHVLTWSYYT